MKPFMIGVHSDGVRNIYIYIYHHHHHQKVEYANPATLAEAVAPNNAGFLLLYFYQQKKTIHWLKFHSAYFLVCKVSIWPLDCFLLLLTYCIKFHATYLSTFLFSFFLQLLMFSSGFSGFYLNYWMNSNCIYYKTTAA